MRAQFCHKGLRDSLILRIVGSRKNENGMIIIVIFRQA
jgi:hypothetical protein